ncbi:TniQ family protein [Inhella inkyongensis]|nr:TniQ family protein [Inhella inkyongensis]
MVLRLQPLPDELDRSYLGALMRVNALATEEEVRTHLATLDDSAALPWRRNPTLKLLSTAAGMDLAGFVMNHTTLPLRRSITSYMPDLAHGCDSNLVLIHVSGKRSCREGAYLCPDCVWEDVDFHGRSYWRRAHQLPGVYWCGKHRAPLAVVKDERAFLQPPSQALGQSARIDGAWVDTLQQHPTVRRFLDLCDTLMDRTHAFPVIAARDALRAAARTHGFRTYATKAATACADPLLSDALVDGFPSSWLAQLVPGLPAKARGRIWHQVDGVLWTATSASAATIYILAMAVLFDSADAAIQAIEGAVIAPRQPLRVRSPNITDDAAREAYVQTLASHARLQRSHPAGWYPLVQAQLKLGLPGLPHAQSGGLWTAVKAFFLEGRSLADALALAAPHQAAFEKVLLGAGSPLAMALREIVSTPQEATRGKPRIRARLSALDATGLIDKPVQNARGGAEDSRVGRRPLRAQAH